MPPHKTGIHLGVMPQVAQPGLALTPFRGHLATEDVHHGTHTWGLALLAAALFLVWTQSIPWALTAAGIVAVIGGVIKALPVWLTPERRRANSGQLR